MMSIKSLEQYTNQFQTGIDNIVREYCQHLFLSYFFQEPGSEKILFKGGTALRIVFQSPRFSEDLDFSAFNVSYNEINKLIINTLKNIEKSGLVIEIEESKKTSGGYLAIIIFKIENYNSRIQIEISLRRNNQKTGERALIHNKFIPAYTLVFLPTDYLVQEKIKALLDRQKPRDFFDYFFLLSGDFKAARDNDNLHKVLNLLKNNKTDFRREFQKFLPISQARNMKDFKSLLINKIKGYMGQ